MPPSTPYRAALPRLLVPALLTVLPLAGCGTPPELRQPASGPTTPAVTPRPTFTGPPTPTGTPSAPGLSPTTLPTAPPAAAAQVCGQRGPTGDQVIRLLQGPADVLPDGLNVRARTGPLCADDWHYTVLELTGYEQLQVVTRGGPGTLRLVTAGTDVCTIEVRTVAPTGVRTLACADGPLGGPGA